MIEEIDRRVLEKETDEDDLLSKMSYMDLFIRQVLRMYPLIIRAASRECHRRSSIGGHRIERGSVIQPSILTIHFNADLWGPEDPKEFIPERHSTW